MTIQKKRRNLRRKIFLGRLETQLTYVLKLSEDLLRDRRVDDLGEVDIPALESLVTACGTGRYPDPYQEGRRADLERDLADEFYLKNAWLAQVEDREFASPAYAHMIKLD